MAERAVKPMPVLAAPRSHFSPNWKQLLGELGQLDVGRGDGSVYNLVPPFLSEPLPELTDQAVLPA